MENTITRRKMLATSAGTLLGVSTFASAASPSEKAEVGDKTPHLNFSLQRKSFANAKFSSVCVNRYYNACLKTTH
jgi:hypothetical protein